MKERICAGILAGGASSRMKQNKALLELDGRSMLQRAFDACSGFGQRLVSVDHAARYAGLDLPFVEDKDAGIGPKEGLIRLMEEMKADWLLLLAVDLPMISAGFLEALADHLDPASDGLVLLDGQGRYEPLCAIYSRRLLPLAKEQKAAGEKRMKQFVEAADVKYITADALGFSGDFLLNMNTPEDYRRVLTGRNET